MTHRLIILASLWLLSLNSRANQLWWLPITEIKNRRWCYLWCKSTAVEHTCQLVKHKPVSSNSFKKAWSKIKVFVLTGDFNDYDFSTTAQILAGSELTNLMAQHDVGVADLSYFVEAIKFLITFYLKQHGGQSKFEPVHQCFLYEGTWSCIRPWSCLGPNRL